jgi:pimeloyl-ACP methyl ester carboxylesterase
MKDKILLWLIYFCTVPIWSCYAGIDLQDYVEIQVAVESDGDSLYGSLLMPEKDFFGTVVLIIAGSGPTDRDGNQIFMVNNALKMLASALAQEGIASLRYDKRGVMASIPRDFKEADLRFDDYVSDAQAWLQWLKMDKRFSDIFVVGHSEGSLIGMIASRKVPVTGFISLAGTGRMFGDLVLEQLGKQMDDNQLRVVADILDSLKSGQTVKNVPGSLHILFRPSVQPYLMSWMQYNPLLEISRLDMPVLIIQGEKDLQVTVNDGEQLHKASKNSDFVIIENMNHVLKNVPGGIEENRASYTDPAFLLSKKLAPEMAVFIQCVSRITD